jgi:hypothetical protein
VGAGIALRPLVGDLRTGVRGIGGVEPGVTWQSGVRSIFASVHGGFLGIGLRIGRRFSILDGGVDRRYEHVDDRIHALVRRRVHRRLRQEHGIAIDAQELSATKGRQQGERAKANERSSFHSDP